MTDPIHLAQKYMNEQIPITRHLGVKVLTFDGKQIVLYAPLAENINHRGTVFGGSLASVAMLAGWTLLHLTLANENVASRLVIQKNKMDFLKPVQNDFKTVCVLPEQEQWDKFIHFIKRKNKARLEMKAELFCEDELVAVHIGNYVAVQL